jgi:hypothetical protein
MAISDDDKTTLFWVGLGLVILLTLVDGWAWVGYYLGLRGHPSQGVSTTTSVPGTGPRYGGDLDCEDIGREIHVGRSDPHGLDRDGDGIGCEGW